MLLISLSLQFLLLSSFSAANSLDYSEAIKSNKASNESAKLLPLPDGIAGEGSWLGRSVSVGDGRAVVGAPNAAGSGAVYILEFDGIDWQEVGILRYAGDGLKQFGNSVAMRENLVVVGAKTDALDSSGVVVVFELIGNEWVEKQILMASDGSRLNNFGKSIALSVNRMLIGAPGDNRQGKDYGAAYVFDFVGGAWTESQKLVANDPLSDSQFGSAVSLWGDQALIAAVGDDTLGDFTGSAYVFDFTGGSWQETQKLTASDAGGRYFFGSSVSLTEDWLVIGAVHSYGVDYGSGAVYVFKKNSGIWIESQKLIPDEGTYTDDFGFSVKVSDERMMIGDPLKNVIYDHQGAIYQFNLVGSQWIQAEKIIASDGFYQDGFAVSLDLYKDFLITGASNVNAEDEIGGAYVFNLADNQWTEKFKLTDKGAAKDGFGSAVSAHGDMVLIGAPGDNEKGKDAGAAYLFQWDGFSWGLMQKLTADDAGQYNQFGTSVNLQADRLMIGVTNTIFNDNGAVYVFDLHNDEFIQSQKLTVDDGGGFGAFISQSGNRVLIGASLDDEFSWNSGAAYVFEYNGVNWEEIQKLKAADPLSRDHFGTNGSLVDNRLLVSGRNAVYAFEFAEDEWRQTQELVSADFTHEDFFGSAVSMAGETALIGAWNATDSGIETGAAYVFKFTDGSWVQEQKLLASDGTAGSRFGNAVSLSTDQLLIGSVYDDFNGYYSGSAYLFSQENGLWVESEKFLASDGTYGDFLATSLALSSSHALVGAPFDDERGEDAGSVYVYDVLGSGQPSAVMVPATSIWGLLILAFSLICAVRLLRQPRKLIFKDSN